MCGIVGAIANRDVVPVLVDGLKRLEYRGYDSAGVAVVVGDAVRRVRRTGRVAEMEAAAVAEGLGPARLGIGHTRWATHGGVTEANAHPHISHGELALVHNGIIENHEQQRERLRALGYVFESQTDTEVIAHLIHHYRAQGASLLAALQQAVKELHGAYALAVIDRREPDMLVAARMGCPLLVGLGEGEHFVASDVSAIVSATRRVIYLEEGDTVALTRDSVQVFDASDRPVTRDVHVSDVSLAALELGPYRHFMQKEIHEQPRAISDTAEGILDAGDFVPSL
ncbi:MAG: glutamine--fructose-6-phosphate aminotransferase, partial [Thermomonas hydrothermalis]|nr:glutamine--fructose-6-phosphate aminotransferase [Thermomonas hydrothermalis]